MVIFRFSDENSGLSWGFKLPDHNYGDIEDLLENDDHTDGPLMDLVWETESEYGVHDWGGYRLSDGPWVVGYHSYEIELENYPILIARYRKFFEDLGWKTEDWLHGEKGEYEDS